MLDATVGHINASQHLKRAQLQFMHIIIAVKNI